MNDDPIVLELEWKLSEKFKVSKSSKIFKNIKKYWKDEIKSKRSHNDIEKTVSRKAKDHLQQEKVKCNTYEENDFQNGSYISEKCKSSLKRQSNVRCSSCKFWYDCYFPIFVDLPLKQPDFVCSNCNAELFHELCCLFYLSQPMNINTFCDIWNDKFNNNDRLNSLKIVTHKLQKKKLRTTIYSQRLIKCQRGVLLIKNLTAWSALCCRFCIIHRYRIAWKYLRNHLLQHFTL